MLIVGNRNDYRESAADGELSLMDSLRRWRESLASEISVGLVPTMGALHEGHLSLIREAKRRCDVVALTIFVNPTQFAPEEDLATYPKTLEADLEHAAAEGVDFVWIGGSNSIYPEGFAIEVTFPTFANRLCGKSRPQHFVGVCLIVLKLFHLFQPTLAFFGEKDLQQVTIIERMTLDLNLPIEIVRCPLVREADGLALSSRNQRLSPSDREAALSLWRGLRAIRESWASGEREPSVLREVALPELDSRLDLEYLEILDKGSLNPLDSPARGGEAVACIAAHVGEVRLIDNVTLEID